MSSTPPEQEELAAIRGTAAQWTVRRDRGLSASESIEFELWLAADPRHRLALRSTGRAWSLLDNTPEGMARRELAASARRRRLRRYTWAAASLTAAAALALAAYRFFPADIHPAPTRSGLVAAGPRVLTLADGSVVQLNVGSEISELFTARAREVRLTRGEAHFAVEKDPSRPFVVRAGALRVQAVGTAFNVNVQSAQVEVLVTEGRVKLASELKAQGVSREVGAGERAVLSTSRLDHEIVVTAPPAAEIARTLAWHDTVVRLGGARLAELATEFQRRFGQRMIIADPATGDLRAGGRLRADDAEAFAKLLAQTFDLEVERTADGSWVLRKKNVPAR